MISLLLDIEYPELIPSLTIPMQYFPVFAFFATDPFFKQGESKYY